MASIKNALSIVNSRPFVNLYAANMTNSFIFYVNTLPKTNVVFF
jgi:hypothetical protein